MDPWYCGVEEREVDELDGAGQDAGEKGCELAGGEEASIQTGHLQPRHHGCEHFLLHPGQSNVLIQLYCRHLDFGILFQFPTDVFEVRVETEVFEERGSVARGDLEPPDGEDGDECERLTEYLLRDVDDGCLAAVLAGRQVNLGQMPRVQAGGQQGGPLGPAQLQRLHHLPLSRPSATPSQEVWRQSR